MQELRFVGIEHGDVIATSSDGTRYRLVVDEALRDALRPRAAARSVGPKVPPRVIQQLIRAGRTVDEVVDSTGAERELVARFEGPILAERGYIVEQARSVSVRVQQPLDPLAGEGATFGSAIDDRLEQLAANSIRWDAWKDPETGWHVGLDFVTDDVTRNALWSFDAKIHSLQAISPAAITLSQQGELPPLGGPHLRAVDVHPTDAVIPAPPTERPRDHFAETQLTQTTANETADLLDALRRRRGERSAAPYDEEAEYGDDEFEFNFQAGLSDVSTVDDAEDSAPQALVTPFARTRPEHPSANLEANHDEPDDEPQAEVTPVAAEPEQHDSGVVPLDGLERTDAERAEADRADDARQQRRKGGRPSMPSWDEIVFGTKTDDD
ncbi:septation protein SepH [Gulosibacter macacae]|nr:septation protein SepH [Gulosibacter macacae]